MIVSDARAFQSTLKIQISDNRRQFQFTFDVHRQLSTYSMNL